MPLYSDWYVTLQYTRKEVMPSASYPTKKACRVRAVRSTLNQASDAMLYAKCSSHANLFEIRRAGV